MTDTAYPYIPRSNGRLRPGEFWAIPLRTGRFACGIVLGVARAADPHLLAVNARAFLGGLLEWEGDAAPTSQSIAGAAVAGQGIVHIRTITETGGAILGRVAAPIPPLAWRSAPGPRDDGWVYDGIDVRRPATRADHGLPLITGWGFGYMRELAEQAAETTRRRGSPPP